MPPFGFLPHCSAETMTRDGIVRREDARPEGPMNRLCCVVESAGHCDWANGIREWRGRNGRQRFAERACSATLLGRRNWNGGGRTYPLVGDRLNVTACPRGRKDGGYSGAAIQPAATPDSPSPATSTTSEAPAPPADANLSVPASIPGPTAVLPPPKRNLLSYSVPVGSILLYENFSHYREGDATDWGPNTFVKTGLDRRNWLVSNVDGTHPVGRRLRLPNEFYFECRYSAYMPEVTRGILGWWKDPVSTRISLLNDQGARYTIQWVVKCGNDPTRLNPLGSSSPFAKKYYHTISLPDGTTNEVGVIQPTGMLRIDRDNNVVKVFVDGQAAVVGTMSPMGQLVGFEIDVVKAKNGTLFFTDFTIAR